MISRYFAPLLVVRVVLATADMRMLRLWLALGGLLWGLVLLIPQSMYPDHGEVNRSCASWTPCLSIHDLFSTPSFGMVVGLLFIVQSFAAIYSVIFKVYDRTLLIPDAVLGCALWSLMAVATITAQFIHVRTFIPPSPMAADVLVMLASWWSLIRFISEEPNEPN